MTTAKAEFTVHLRSDSGSLFSAARDVTTDDKRREYLREEIISGFQRDGHDPDDDAGTCSIACRDVLDMYYVLDMARKLGIRPSIWASVGTESVRATAGLNYNHVEKHGHTHGECRITKPTVDSAHALALIESAKRTMREIAEIVTKPQ